MSYGSKRIGKRLPDKANCMHKAQRQRRAHQVAPEMDERDDIEERSWRDRQGWTGAGPPVSLGKAFRLYAGVGMMRLWRCVGKEGKQLKSTQVVGL